MKLKKIIGILISVLLVSLVGNVQAAPGKLPTVRVYDGGAYELNEKLKAGGFILSDSELKQGKKYPGDAVTPYCSITWFSKSYVCITYLVNDEGHVSYIMIEGSTFEKNDYERITRQICSLLGLTDSQTDKLFNNRHNVNWFLSDRIEDMPYVVAKNRKFNMVEEAKGNSLKTFIWAFR